MNQRSSKPEARTPGSIIIVSAPSGSGKTTLVHRLLDACPQLRFSVSYTTRPPRRGEKHGREYFFVTRKQFNQMIQAGEFIEWAEVVGEFYGTARQQLHAAQEAGQDILLDIDIQGHRQVRRKLPEAVSIFILPPSFQELERRLRRRKSDTPDSIERRLRNARREIGHWKEYDFVVVNDRLRAATKSLRAIVEAARARACVQRERAKEISQSFGG
jgi:guanylate kinase